MKEIKLIHCADVHIGAELTTLGYKARKRKAEIKQTFFKILSICKEENVDFLLIAGDMLDHNKVDYSVIEEIRQGFAQIRQTNILIVPGNHDFIHEDSFYLKENFWPSNVSIWKESLEYKEFPEYRLRVWGGAFTSSYVTKSLLKGVKVPKDHWINIGLFHGELVAEGGKSNYNPITEKQIENCQLNYLALGHIHKSSPLKKIGNTYFAYPGCPEGQGFDELDEKGIYFGTITNENCNLKFLPISQRNYIEIRINVSDITHTSQAEKLILDVLSKKYGEDFGNHLYKIILEGSVTEDSLIQLEDLKVRLEQELFYVKVIDQTQMQFDYNVLAKEEALKGIFVRRMLEKIDACKNEHEKQVCQNALNIGLKAFYGEVKYRED